MHLNHYFLAQLAQELHQQLVGAWLVECFSQNKDELVLGFAKAGEDFYLKCQVGPAFQGFSFSTSFHRAKSNSVDLFPKAKELQVQSVSLTPNDRSFRIELEGEMTLLFKMHGNRSNVLLFQQGKGIDQYHKSSPDLALPLSSFAKEVPFDMGELVTSQFDFKKLLPAIGKEPLEWLTNQRFQEASEEDKIELVCQMLEILQHPAQFYVVERQGKAQLTFFETLETVLGRYATAVEAANGFQRLFYTVTQHAKQKAAGQKTDEEKRRKLEKNIRDLETKLFFLEEAKSNEQTGDILMAHLQEIPAGAEKVTLFDFYQNKEREIKLKRDLSAQKNAELYYQKAKDASTEKEHVAKTLALKKGELEKWEKEAQTQSSFTESTVSKQKKNEDKDIILPYKKFDIEGFEVRVGKNSQKNDELTLHYAQKNDLWLHARGYAGSHVVIKEKPGTPFPSQVIEKAAAIAAWYSKGKNDSLCPVIVTEKKYVRKAKHMHAGQVIVEKEKVVLVVPQLF